MRRVHLGKGGEALRVVCVGDVGLRTVEDVIFSIRGEFCLRLDVSRIGAEIRFREGVRKYHLSRCSERKILALLLLGSV